LAAPLNGAEGRKRDGIEVKATEMAQHRQRMKKQEAGAERRE
jgi:hypothetical protein